MGTTTYTTNLGLTLLDALGDEAGNWHNLWKQDSQRIEARLTATYAGNPTGNVQSYWIGQLCFDTTNGVLYRATNVAVAASATWERVNRTIEVSSNDTTPSYLENKITVGTALTKTISNEGGNEAINLTPTLATQAQAEAGALNTVLMTPLRAKQLIDSLSLATETYADNAAAAAVVSDQATRISASSNTTCNNATWTEIGFNGNVYDDQSWEDVANNGITPDTDIRADIEARIRLAATANGDIGIRIKVAGSVVKTKMIDSGATSENRGIDIVLLAEPVDSGQRVTVEVYQATGSNQVTVAAECFLTVARRK